MRRLLKLWTAVVSAAFVMLGAALGGVGLVDFTGMLAIAVVPQVILLWWGQWPEVPYALEDRLIEWYHSALARDWPRLSWPKARTDTLYGWSLAKACASWRQLPWR
ncbi:hypothetical protein SFA35_13110 [Pseudomonas sp. HR96]|uniref:hypothetical protein n=1 Tax=Pseudomonas sp. HR96 TaxID=1027966 RepID=UPI002A7574DB|nr:hypothetical protein [Pseudomonas sp. HR96]WPO97608.1 hypothetical protein SFA35_13110 [Pseudomonas sp. HR96]